MGSLSTAVAIPTYKTRCCCAHSRAWRPSPPLPSPCTAAGDHPAGAAGGFVEPARSITTCAHSRTGNKGAHVRCGCVAYPVRRSWGPRPWSSSNRHSHRVLPGCWKPGCCLRAHQGVVVVVMSPVGLVWWWSCVVVVCGGGGDVPCGSCVVVVVCGGGRVWWWWWWRLVHVHAGVHAAFPYRIVTGG